MRFSRLIELRDAIIIADSRKQGHPSSRESSRPIWWQSPKSFRDRFHSLRQNISLHLCLLIENLISRASSWRLTNILWYPMWWARKTISLYLICFSLMRNTHNNLEKKTGGWLSTICRELEIQGRSALEFSNRTLRVSKRPLPRGEINPGQPRLVPINQRRSTAPSSLYFVFLFHVRQKDAGKLIDRVWSIIVQRACFSNESRSSGIFRCVRDPANFVQQTRNRVRLNRLATASIYTDTTNSRNSSRDQER